jgi:hypothetical protein
MSTSTKPGFALIADVVGSTGADDFVRVRDRCLRELSARHREGGRIRADYTVTAWDEFQTFLWEGHHLPRIVLELREGFAPWKLRIGIGQGDISGWRSRRPINLALGGVAFERAREALTGLVASGGKYPHFTRFHTGHDELDDLLNLIYGLHDTLVEDITARQWETVAHALRGISQEEIGRLLGVAPSTVSRNLHRGHYWQLQETLDTVTRLLGRSM